MLYYDEYGNKENPTILLLHGAGALDTFCRQYCFSDKYHLVVPHLAGAGKAAAEIYEPEKTVEELFTVIKTLHKNRIGVIGHSLGGQIAIMLVSKKQADNMAEYSKQITPLVYHSFFSNTLDLSKLPEYQAVTIPMLAICGSKEVRDMKTSLTLLAQNPNCQTMTLQGANHDFPMRNAKQLNPMLEKFILECL